ncbi:MAG TPA: MerR family transcriptional regulator [Bacteroidales bacterium]|nr:MerR family transcriptional regulator [Bacteroidales bacterium]
MKKYKIGEFAKMVDLTPRTIRYYQEKGIFDPVTGHNNYRYFTKIDLHIADFVKRCQMLGISLDEIADLAKAYRRSDTKKIDHLIHFKEVIEEHIEEIEKKEAILKNTKKRLLELKQKFEEKIERFDIDGEHKC